jgi:N-sulfoglucosamine sulfohydrolase
MHQLHLTRLVVALLSPCLPVQGAAESKPNLVFIIADDLTFRDIGCYGGQALTPHIDKLAGQGIRMTRCFQAAPMCSPTRHNIYTGLYPVKSGAYPNHTFARDDVKSVVHYLRPLGYRVALSGKTHIGPKKVFPFEYSKGDGPDMAAIDKLMGECAANKTPFCLFVCSNEPHSPWDKGDASKYPPARIKLPPYYIDTPDLRKQFSKYLAEITFFDGQVGRVLDILEKRGVADNTLVMVVSEQGNSFPFAKWTLYDSGLQSAMIVRWPGHVKAATTSDAMVEYVDVLPTFIDVAGGSMPAVLDGKSMLPVLTGKSDHLKDYVFGIQTSRGINEGPEHFGRRSVRSVNYKLIHNLDPTARFFNVICQTPYFKEWEARAQAGDQRAAELVLRFHSPPEFELFDVIKDPLELHNLAGNPEYAPVIAGLKTQLALWMEQQGDLGQATEMAAYGRMTGGNAAAKAGRKRVGGAGRDGMGK